VSLSTLTLTQPPPNNFCNIGTGTENLKHFVKMQHSNTHRFTTQQWMSIDTSSKPRPRLECYSLKKKETPNNQLKSLRCLFLSLSHSHFKSQRTLLV